MALKRGYKALVEEAYTQVQTLPLAEAIALHGDPNTVFVDVRDIRELERDGVIPGAFHAPRGMLEFWVDPDSPYHKPVFSEGKRLVFFCAAGWRSALSAKTAQDMGLEDVCHFEGGFSGWKKAGGPVAEKTSGKSAGPKPHA